MSIPKSPIGSIRELVAFLNLDVIHLFEDLVFIQHNPFLIKMGEHRVVISSILLKRTSFDK